MMNEEQGIMREERADAVAYEIDYRGLAIFAVLLIVAGALAYGLSYKQQSAPPLAVEEETDVQQTPVVDPFANVHLLGKAAYVYDVVEGKPLFSYNEETQLPLASLTKLMTAVAVLRFMNANDTVTIEPDSLEKDGDSGLFAFEEWKLKDLLDYTLTVSSNDGAAALAAAAGTAKMVRGSTGTQTPEEAFVNEMNTLTKEIGLSQTYFVNETGLDPTAALSGGYGSARDTALLLEYIIKHEPTIMEATTYPSITVMSESDFIHTATNTDDAVPNIPELIASKTGYTDLAGGNLVVAFDAGVNHPIIICVLGSTIDGRFSDVEQLVRASLAYVTNTP